MCDSQGEDPRLDGNASQGGNRSSRYEQRLRTAPEASSGVGKERERDGGEGDISRRTKKYGVS